MKRLEINGQLAEGVILERGLAPAWVDDMPPAPKVEREISSRERCIMERLDSIVRENLMVRQAYPGLQLKQFQLYEGMPELIYLAYTCGDERVVASCEVVLERESRVELLEAGHLSVSIGSGGLEGCPKH